MKKNKKIGAIDIGSHNCRLLVVEKHKNSKKIIFNHSKPTNLIKNLSFNNEFSFQNISKTLSCLNFFKKKLDYFQVSNYRCIATEACRGVINPEFFIHEVKKDSGLEVEIISSDEEARLSLKSCKDYFEKIKEYGLLFDIGGGSTETSIFCTNPFKYSTVSISYGVINHPEKVEIFGEDFIKKKLVHHFSSFFNSNKDFTQNFTSIGSCSTMTTLCSVFQNHSFYDPKRIEGFEMKIDDVKNTINYIEKMSSSNLRNHPCIKNKYKLLLNGVKILSAIIHTIPIEKIIVTQKGLRDALIEEL